MTIAPEILNTSTRDGLALEALLYRAPGGAARAPVLCLPGLTRNVRDFEDLAPIIAQRGRDVFTLSFRGRGGSARDSDFRRYHALVYRDDVLHCLDQWGVARAIFLGVSLGGLVTALTAQEAPARVAGAVLNDIGPKIAPEGLARIVAMVSAPRSDAADLSEAADRVRAANADIFPDADDAFWRMAAKRVYRELPGGGWSLDYDPGIGRALLEPTVPVDYERAFDALKPLPALLIRGETSDVLDAETALEMRERHGAMGFCEVPAVGHAPTLSEPSAADALDRFLARLA